MLLVGQTGHASSSGVHSQLITCLQSMAEVSSTVHGLGRSAPRVRPSLALSGSVGVGFGCHRGPVKFAEACHVTARQHAVSPCAGSAHRGHALAAARPCQRAAPADAGWRHDPRRESWEKLRLPGRL